ncbi:MAG TPA: hypothetical protein VH207_12080 [Chthoniobacterales bacterium]|nr:hypothetical protein [Chthoniobacterales bacterium]
MKRSATVRLLFFALAVLLVPMALNHTLPSKTPFNRQPLERLRAVRPGIVLIGDSLVHAAIDPQLLQKELADGKVEMIWRGGAASAAWYLSLKNYVAASGVQPRWCCIFFTYDLLTNATFRTTATYLSYLESLMHQDEPVFQLVLGDQISRENPPERLVSWLYPLTDRRHHYQEKISRFAFRTEALLGPNVKGLPRRVNEIFDVARLRQETLPQTPEAEAAQPLIFTADPRKNFLPHIVEAAAKAGIPLCFVRVRPNPGPDNQFEESEELRSYVAQLRRWIESQGCTFIDTTANQKLTPDMYLRPDDDHIGPWAKERATLVYAEELRPLMAR